MRLEYFAGQRPWLPRRIGRDEFLARCRETRTRFVVFVPKRGQLQPPDVELLGYPRARVDADLDRALQERGIAVFER